MADDTTFYVPGSKYKIDEDLINEINDLYARVLDRSALNVADPIAANVGYFNTTGKKPATDPPMIGKTHVFITRPNLNFRAPNNILRSHVFQYYYGTKLGRTLMRQLMHSNIAGTMRLPSNAYPFAPHDGPCTDRIVGGITMKDDFTLPYLNTNFIPLLSNTCTETSNAKDIILSTYETDGDFSGNKLTYAAGADETLSIGEVTLTFDDIYFSPVMHTFVLWIMYIHYACKGIVTPYWRYIVDRIIDYSCSIYIFMLDVDQETIVRYVRYGGCFPRTIPFGAIQHSQEPNSQSLRNLPISFSYNFYEPMNPMSLTEFNMLNESALIARNPGFANMINRRTHSLTDGDLTVALDKGYKPTYNKNDSYKSQLPQRILDYNDTKKDVLNIDPYTTQVTMLNKSADNILNNWYGIPFITEGNKLRFI